MKVANFFRVLAVLVLLAAGYMLYADYPAYNSGTIGLVGYLGDFAFAAVLAGVLWVFAKRAVREAAE